MGFLKSMFSDGAGNVSIMRVIILLSVVDILTVYTIKNIQSTTGLIDFTTNAVAVLIVIITGKVVQNVTEIMGNKKENEEVK